MEQATFPIKTKIAAWWLIVLGMPSFVFFVVIFITGIIKEKVSLSAILHPLILVSLVISSLLIVVGISILRKKRNGWKFALFLPIIFLLSVRFISFASGIIYIAFIFFIPALVLLIIDRNNFLKIASDGKITLKKKIILVILMLIVALSVFAWKFFKVCDNSDPCVDSCCGCLRDDDKSCDGVECEALPYYGKCKYENGECKEGSKIISAIETILKCESHKEYETMEEKTIKEAIYNDIKNHENVERAEIGYRINIYGNKAEASIWLSYGSNPPLGLEYIYKLEKIDGIWTVTSRDKGIVI